MSTCDISVFRECSLSTARGDSSSPFEDFHFLLETCPLELPLSSGIELRILNLLSRSPEIAISKDSEGLLLLHRLCVFEFPSHSIIEKLIALVPRVLLETAVIGCLEGTALHFLLLNQSPDYDLALKMLESCPLVAR